MEIKTLCEKDIEVVLSFEKKKLESSDMEPMQKELYSWKAPWRQESLEYYLPKGWSFAFFDPAKEELLGYFMAQPLLFYRGLTQNLWVEHLSCSADFDVNELIDVAYKLARSKHFQSVQFYNCESYLQALQSRNPIELEQGTYMLKTAKL